MSENTTNDPADPVYGDYRDLAFSSIEAANLGIKRVRYNRENKHKLMPIHIEGLERAFRSLRNREMCLVLAQTHNMKTTFMQWWANFLAERYAEFSEDEIIVYIDYESGMEDIALEAYMAASPFTGEQLDTGNVDDNELLEYYWDVANNPVYRIAASQERGTTFSDMDLSSVQKALDYVRSSRHGRPLKIAAVFVDYLQAIPASTKYGPNGRRLQVRDDIYTLFDWGSIFDCPVIVGVQAKQNIKNQAQQIKIPTVYDGEESSSIGQRPGKIITLWMPKNDYEIGDTFEYKYPASDGSVRNVRIRVASNLLMVGFPKMRVLGGSRSGMVVPCEVDFVRQQINLLDLRKQG